MVIPGPYGLRYGPGLSYIDIVMQDTPRYSDGPGSDYRATVTWRPTADSFTDASRPTGATPITGIASAKGTGLATTTSPETA